MILLRRNSLSSDQETNFDKHCEPEERHIRQGSTHRWLLELYNLGYSSKWSQSWSIHVIAYCNDGSADWLCCLLCLLLDLKGIGFVVCACLISLLLTGPSVACNSKTQWKLRLLSRCHRSCRSTRDLLLACGSRAMNNIFSHLHPGTTWQAGQQVPPDIWVSFSNTWTALLPSVPPVRFTEKGFSLLSSLEAYKCFYVKLQAHLTCYIHNYSILQHHSRTKVSCNMQFNRLLHGTVAIAPAMPSTSSTMTKFICRLPSTDCICTASWILDCSAVAVRSSLALISNGR